MDTPYQAPLTPEQIAAINAGDGFALCEDPATHVQYQLIRNEEITLDDDYFREKLAEAQADVDRGEVAEWNVDEIKRELAERLSKKQSRT
jgi:signal transduction protein with GAF and PtsI domain